MAAPMFLASGVDLVLAACRAGVIGAFPTANPRTPEGLQQWLAMLTVAEGQARDRGQPFAPYCVNLLASAARDREDQRAKLAVCRAARVPLVLTNMGDPREVVVAVHDWGGIVLHDVTTIRHAEKAAAAGVDGMVLVCGGAGGHAGALSPFAFVPQVRSMFGGLIVLGGGISDGAGVAAALTLGADLAVLGTRFIASRESAAAPAHKQMLVDAGTDDILYTEAISGLPANFLRPSIVAAGLDPDALPRPKRRHVPDLPDGVKAWKHIWSGGHGTGAIRDVPTVADLVDRLTHEFADACRGGDWRETLAHRLG